MRQLTCTAVLIYFRESKLNIEIDLSVVTTIPLTLPLPPKKSSRLPNKVDVSSDYLKCILRQYFIFVLEGQEQNPESVTGQYNQLCI